MSMSWTQYLLGKLAEEASEVTKEALKCQQQGVASPWKGRAAIFELRNELIEVMAVCQMLEGEADVQKALDEHRLIHMPSENEDLDFHDIKYAKIERVCYYAMFAYRSGNLELSIDQYRHVKTAAIRYGTKHNLTMELFDVI